MIVLEKENLLMVEDVDLLILHINNTEKHHGDSHTGHTCNWMFVLYTLNLRQLLKTKVGFWNSAVVMGAWLYKYNKNLWILYFKRVLRYVNFVQILIYTHTCVWIFMLSQLKIFGLHTLEQSWACPDMTNGHAQYMDTHGIGTALSVLFTVINHFFPRV